MKYAAHWVMLVLFGLLLLPLWLPVRLTRPIDRREVAFQFGSQLVSLIPGLPGVFARRAFYLPVLPQCGRDVVIEFGTILAQRDTAIGDRVYIGAFCNIGMSRIGHDVLIGSNVDIISGRHVHNFGDTDRPIRAQPIRLETTCIGEGSWIGNRSVIMADIGHHAVVGAGSVVTRPCDDYTVNGGNPARLLKHRRGDRDNQCHGSLPNIRQAQG